MNMKKAIAGVLAGVVAVSAMATMALSAAEKNQEAKTIEYDLVSRGWQAVWSVSNEITGKLTRSGTTTSYEGVEIVPGTYVLDPDSDLSISDLKITVEGKAPVTEAMTTKSYAIKDNKITFVDASAVSAAEGEIALGNFEVITSVKITGTVKTAEYRSEDAAKAAAKAALNIPMTVENAAGVTLGGNVDWSLKDDEGECVKMEDAATEIVLNSAGVPMNSLFANMGYDMVTNLSNTKGATITMTFTVEKTGATLPGMPGGPALDYQSTAGVIKDLAIAPAQTYLAKNQLIEDLGNGIWTIGDKWLVAFSGKVQGASDIKDGVATFNWDEIVAGSTLSISNLAVCNDIVIGCKPALAGTVLKLEKVVIDIPAKTVDDITLGAGTEDETPAPVDTPATEAPADTEATEATSAEANPGTGNAPIALAVIPVALAAAAIVAKKRG